MERHPVPQNIMDVEFKLFGALTVRQFGYAAAGFIFALISYFTPFPDLLRYIFIGISIAAGLFLSLVKINGQPSTVWVSNFVVSMLVPQERLWRKSRIIPEVLKNDPNLRRKTDPDVIDILTKDKLNKLPAMPLEKLSPAETELDQQEEKNLKQIDEHFDFLFNQLPKIKTTPVNPMQGQNTVAAFKKESSKVAETELPVIKTPNTIAEAVRSGYDQDKVYVNENYAVPFKPLAGEVNRPLKLGEVTKPDTTVKPVPEIDPASLPVQPWMVNVVNGVVNDKKGQPLAGAKISVSDKSGTMVRSVTSTGQGAFTLASGLDNGTYTLDASKEGYKFARYTIDLKGDRILTTKITAQ